MVVDFLLPETVDMETFTEIMNGTFPFDVELSFLDENGTTGRPCLSGYMRKKEEPLFSMEMDAQILALTDAACQAWEQYTGLHPEIESHYQQSNRFFFIEKYIADFTSLAQKLFTFSVVSGLFDEEHTETRKSPHRKRIKAPRD